MIHPLNARVLKASSAIPPQHVVLVEPLSCALRAVEQTQTSFENVVVIDGCVLIGLGRIADAVVESPAEMVALNLDPRKLEVAKECGATRVLNLAEENPNDLIMSLIDGYECDFYREGAGHPSAGLQGLLLLRK